MNAPIGKKREPLTFMGLQMKTPVLFDILIAIVILPPSINFGILP
jgi:hypothetical protein